MDTFPRPGGHIVLTSADSEAFASLRRPATLRTERHALGKGLRTHVPRSSLGDWHVRDDRRHPVDQIEESHRGRLDWLIGVRVGRMIASPYGFLRGTATVMAEDLAALPATGITPVICGDAHLGNFGFYGSPERDLVMDLNDFDEAHPGAWEWDLRRLAASIWVAGRQNGLTENQCEEASAMCVAAYRWHVRELSERPLFERSFDRLDVDRLADTSSDRKLLRQIQRSVARARRRTSDHALPRVTYRQNGHRRFLAEPPLTTPLSDSDAEHLAAAMDDYLLTLAPHWRRAVAGYTIVDLAHRVVGVGSVGLRAYVVLCEGSSAEDVLILQLKEARRSVLAPFVHGDAAWHAHQGQRVVEYQQALQTVSDPLLGWTTVDGREYYVRQFRNMKGRVAVEEIHAAALKDYVGICGQLLAKGHARTSGASMIAGYVGSSDALEVALCRFARAYADQTEQDHAALVDAVARGLLPVESLA
jgi:uncharacterized protein (DUF2252 family)